MDHTIWWPQVPQVMYVMSWRRTRERAAAVGGTVELTIVEPSGLKVVAVLPLDLGAGRP